MCVTRHKRQILLFLSAILVPAGVLVELSGRLLYQDRELSLKRAGDRHRAAVESCAGNWPPGWKPFGSRRSIARCAPRMRTRTGIPTIRP